MIAKDLMTNSTGELLIVDGDFVLGESDIQHIDHILRASQGDYKESPLIGFGVDQYEHATVSAVELAKYKKGIQIQLEYDGFTNVSVEASSFKNIMIDAKRL